MGSKKLREAVLLANQTTTGNGTWFDVAAWSRITVDILGITTGTVQIMGSCEPTKPLDATDGRKIGNDITANAIVEITAKVKWLKIKTTVATSVAIYAYAIGDETAYGF